MRSFWAGGPPSVQSTTKAGAQHPSRPEFMSEEFQFFKDFLTQQLTDLKKDVRDQIDRLSGQIQNGQTNIASCRERCEEHRTKIWEAINRLERADVASETVHKHEAWLGAQGSWFWAKLGALFVLAYVIIQALDLAKDIWLLK